MPVPGLYLFGSYLSSDNPHDIDLLWLYDKAVMSPAEMLKVVKDKEACMTSKFPVPIHHTIMSSSENSETGFIDQVGAVYIGSASDDTERILGRMRRQVDKAREHE